jgi:hypothetical protein
LRLARARSRALTDVLDAAIQGDTKIERATVHFRILQALFEMPRPVRGIALPMLEGRFDSSRPVGELAAAGASRERRWHIGASSGSTRAPIPASGTWRWIRCEPSCSTC